MSWWESPTGTTIGDGPADIAADTLRQLAGARGVGAKPPLADFLAAVAAALRGLPVGTLSGAGASSIRAVSAVFEPRGGRAADARHVSAAPAGAHPGMTAILAEGFRRIVAEYEDELRRKPTLQEVLDSIVFVLRGRPDEFLSGATDGSVTALTAETER